MMTCQASILKTELSPEEKTSMLFPTLLTRGIGLIAERRTLGYSSIHFSIKFND